jgi:hypothetical protein
LWPSKKSLKKWRIWVTQKLRDCLGTPFPDDASIGNCARNPPEKHPLRPINPLFMSHIRLTIFENTKAEQEEQRSESATRQISYFVGSFSCPGPSFSCGGEYALSGCAYILPYYILLRNMPKLRKVEFLVNFQSGKKWS